MWVLLEGETSPGRWLRRRGRLSRAATTRGCCFSGRVLVMGSVSLPSWHAGSHGRAMCLVGLDAFIWSTTGGGGVPRPAGGLLCGRGSPDG